MGDFLCESFGVPPNGRSDHYSVKNMRVSEDRTKIFFKAAPAIAVHITHPKKGEMFTLRTTWGTVHSVVGSENNVVQKGADLLSMWAATLLG